MKPTKKEALAKAAKRTVLVAGSALARELERKNFMRLEKNRRSSKAAPRVSILAAGGTIAGQAESSTMASYSSGRAPVQSLIDAVPEIRPVARIQAEQVANVGSQDMTFANMIELAVRINALFDAGEADGVVVTHGTDTMEETAYFLNLTVKSEKPVVMTGAMRHSTSLSADGPLNIYNAVCVAADPDAAGRGVLVVMNDRIHEAHSLTKSNTTSVETFISPIDGVIGTVNYGKTRYFRRPSRKHTHQSEFTVEGIASLPRVDILYACADMPADLIDCSMEKGAAGIVIAGGGNGNMNAATIESAARAARSGLVVVRGSRVPTGKVGRNMEIDDDSLGFVVSDELNPAKARILLMLALLKKRGPDEIQGLFYDY